MQSQRGRRMVITKEQAATATSYEFYVTFSQEEHSPEDPANPCVNYPTEEYSSYADCDDHFVRRSLPPGLKPFWTVDNISEATNTFSMKTHLLDQRLGFMGLSMKYFKIISDSFRCFKILCTAG